MLLTTNYGTGGSGAEHQLARVLDELAARGWEPTVVARSSGRDEDHGEHVPVVRVGQPGTGPLNAVRFALAAARATARLRPDVTISLQLGSNPVAALGASLFARRRIPSVVRLTGLVANGSQLEARGERPATRLVTRFLLGRVGAVVSPAQHLLDRAGPFTSVVEPRGRVVRNGAPAVERRVGTDLDGPVVWVGRDDPTKHFDHLVALAELMPATAFVAVGVHAGAATLPANLTVTGRVARPEVLDHVAKARAFVGTSSLEGVPNTLLEALTLGVPLAAYDIPGNVEAIEDITHGARLVPLGDVEALRQALTETLADPRGVEGSVPSIEHVTDDWEDLLQRVIEGRDVRAGH